MVATISLTETGVLTALRSLLLAALPQPLEVIDGQDNRVGEPSLDDFIVMTPTVRERLSTNVDTFHDAPGNGRRNALQATRITIQLDVHGPSSTENAQIISTLFRGAYACEFLAATPYDVSPLYAEDPRQLPFVNGEDQVEFRWTVDATLQANIAIGTPQAFATSIGIGKVIASSASPKITVIATPPVKLPAVPPASPGSATSITATLTSP